MAAAVVGVGCSNTATVANYATPRQLQPHFAGAGLIWVTDLAANSLTAYKPSSTGNVPPAQAIVGPHTQLNAPFGIFKTNGLLYVANSASSGLPSVNIYAVTSNGDEAPAHTIIGFHTGLSGPTGIAVTHTGVIIVLNGNDSITSYPFGKYGDVSPVRTISGPNTQLGPGPCGIALHNGRMYVTNGSEVLEFPVNANGDVFPSTLIGGPHTGLGGACGIAVDKDGNIYVANRFGSVTEYAPGSQFDSPPIATLAGPDTLLNNPQGVALNTNPNRLYVINGTGFGLGELLGFYRPANGDQVPFMDITGSNTGMTYCAVALCWGVAF